MPDENLVWVRQGEAFWRAHHEAWKRSDLNQREYCAANGLPLKAFGNWREKFKAEPQPKTRKLLYRRGGLSHTLSHSLSHTLSHVAYTDMRKGIDGLAMLVQGVLRQDLFCGHLFVFRGRRANLIKIVFWDGSGLCLFTKRLEHGVFLWLPNVTKGETLSLNSAQLSLLIDGVDCRVHRSRRKRDFHSSQMIAT